jgi:AcrR family transcriptional regulator
MSAAETGHQPTEPMHERILQHAARLFREKGYTGATTNELAQKLGLKKASLYHHIEKKEDLLYEICLDCLMAINHAVSHALRDVEAPAERLRLLILTHVEEALKRQDEFVTALVDLRHLAPERLEHVMYHHDTYQALVRRTLQAAQQAGVVRRDVSVKMLTLMLLNLLNWTAFWYRADQEMSPDVLGALLLDQFLHGALAPPVVA